MVESMLPDELQARRRALGLTQAQLAERLGVDQSAVSRWEAGTRRIPMPGVLRVTLDLMQDDPEVARLRSANRQREMEEGLDAGA